MRALTFAIALLAATPAAAQTILGGWTSQSFDQVGGRQLVTLVIKADGTYQEQFRGATTLNTYSGRWFFVQGNIARFSIEDWEPKQWCGPQGCVPVSPGPGTTAAITFQNANQFVAQPIDGSPAMLFTRAR